ALVVGARRRWGERPFRPHNLPLTVLGAGLLWFGWFGFNAGSALAANELAVQAFVNTHVAAAAGALAWAVAEWVAGGRPTVLGAVSGLVAGLVAVTPACGFVTPLAAIATGLGGGVLCYFAVAYLKPRLGYDDALDAFGVHGVGGTWGALATGLFASKAVNPAGADGLLLGNAGLLLAQVTAVAVTWAFAGLLTYVLLRLVGLFTPLRVTPDEEETGLDIALHGEEAYADLEPVALAQLFQPAPPALAAGAGAAGRADAGGVVRP
ncbi:MAG: ammonium transporter, partial [Clostridia bacterium]|nr:ammonium transporter [Clostridia bacterium]